MDKDIFRALPADDDDRRYMQAIGEFMFEFSQLEFTFRMAIASRFSPLNDAMMLIEHCDINKLFDGYLRVLETNGLDKEGEIAELVSEFRRINVERVRVAHGTWTPTVSGLAARKTPTNPKSPAVFHFGKIEELIVLTGRCRHMHDVVLEKMLPLE